MGHIVAGHIWIYILVFYNVCIYNCRAQVQSYNFEINEELHGSQFVGSINVPNRQTYRLTVPDDRFTLNGATGELRTTGSIDRDTLDNDAIIHLLAVIDENSRQPVEISVEVLDINDNDPYFAQPALVQINIPETTESGAEYFLPSAKDIDGPANSVSNKYAIVSGDTNKFELIIDSAPGEDALLYLRTTSTFNREEKDSYTLNISASDDGTPSRSAFLTVIVQILDNNDKNPVFDISEYRAKISENTPIGSFVINVTATDDDEGENGLVSYRLSPSSEGRDTFAIDPVTGVITLAQKLDFESTQTYRITLEAYDAGTPVLFGRAFVTVNVENENDNDPSINFRFFPNSATIASVNDEASMGSIVAILSATDKDITRNSDEKLNLSILSGNELGHFRLTLVPAINLGRLEVVGPINRRLIDRYNLTFFVEDGGSPNTRNATSSIEILVNSDNNYYPEFDTNLYRATLSELAPIGTFVQSVSANDNDFGLPGRIMYSITSGNELGWFNIAEQTGLITTNANLNFSLLSFEASDITLEIVAMDESSSPLSTNTNLVIQLLHENNNAPLFRSDFQEIISQNFPADGLVTTVLATDADFGSDGTVTYDITSISIDGILVGNYSYLFSIGSENGSLYVSKTPDVNTVYDITIQASDQGSPQLLTYTTVRFLVEPVANTNPVFYPIKYFAQSTSGPHSDTYICTLMASSQNNIVEFTFLSGDSGFHVDSLTGIVTASRAFTAQTTYMILFDAVDSNGKRSTEPAVVYIIIDNEQTDIQFTDTEFDFVVLEDLSSEMDIGLVSVVNPNPTLVYEILNGDPFNVFSVTDGTLSRNENQSLDYELMETYNLTFIVYKENQVNIPTAYNTAKCTVIVKDVNDNIPVYFNGATRLTPASYTGDVTIHLKRACTEVNNFVANVSSSDLDSGLNGDITYSLTDPLNIFDIDVYGTITIFKPFCPTGPQVVYDVVVTSCDSGSPRFCPELRLKINILSSLKTILAGEIKQTVFNTDINEDASVNSILLNLGTFLPVQFNSPVSVLPNGTIYTSLSYKIVSGNIDDVFSIFPYGQIYLKSQTLDREQYPVYTLGVNITFTDDNMESFTYKVKVLVNVLDSNDNAPMFLQQNQTITVSDNLPMYSKVGACFANDMDTGIRGDITYSLQRDVQEYNGVPLPFSVDKLSGEISTSTFIDREILKRVWNVTSQFQISIITADNKGYESNDTFTTEAKCSIQFLALNKYSPVFSKSFFFVKVPESTNVGAPFFTLRATDRDGDTTFQFRILTNQTTFNLNANSGVLSLNKKLNRQSNEVYNLYAEVSDQGEPSSKFGVAEIEIVVTVPTDAAPVFQNPNFSWSVSEDTRVAQEIGKLPTRHLNNNLISYSISTNEPSSVTDIFYVERTSGRIMLAGSLDREFIKVYNFSVFASNFYNPEALTILNVTIFVKDVNDNFPVFTSPTQFIIDEGNYFNPTMFGFLSASDLDAKSNTQFRFRVLNVNPRSQDFTIDVQQNSGAITIQGILDREAVLPGGLIRITVSVTDNDDPRKALRTTQVVEVLVNDVNDNVPKFTSPDTVFIPSESLAEIGYHIATVLAKDDDFMENGSISFSLVQVDTPGLFTIQPSTGILELNMEVPAGDSIIRNLEVVARDQGVPARFNSMDLHVVIGSQNLNNGPVFQRNSYTGNVLENQSPGTFLVNVQAIGNRVAYYISGVSSQAGDAIPRRPFSVDPITGDVTTLLPLDREQRDTYIVSVVAVDLTSTKANPRLTSTTVEINVLDLNDVPPVFEQSVNEVFIYEQIQPGYVIANIRATDADQAQDTEYGLEVWPTTSNEFEIDSQSGVITVGNDGLDYERTSKYILEVSASDDLHTTTKEIVVNVIDINDNAPRFMSNPFEFYIFETSNFESNSGLFIGSVYAEDIDSFENSRLTYNIDEDSDNGIFMLNETTGSLSISNTYTGLLDREDKDLYVIKIRVTDNGGLFNEAVVFINIIDINDNPPTFIPQKNTFDVLENIPIGYYITTVEAVDVDLGFYGRIEYKIVSGNENNQFTIIPDNGQIILQNPLDHETQNTFHLIVMAYDLSQPKDRLTSYFNLTINVLNVNDNPPTLILPKTLYVEENTKPGLVLLQVGAYDIDSFDTSGFQYSILFQYPNDDFFRIDSNTGILYLQNIYLDREITDLYNLSIEVKDQDTSSVSTVAYLEIIILDSNDNPPIFTNLESEYITQISEDTRLGTNIIKVMATDDDVNWSGAISYDIVLPETSPFEIEQNTGQIYLIGRLDYEKSSIYKLIVQAQDIGLPRLSTNHTVVINVIDLNDCSPILTPSTLVKHVPENQNSDVITQFTVYDNDTGEGGKVDFRSIMVTSVMKNGDYVESDQDFSSLFSVSYDGILSIDEPVNREVADMFNVVVVAVDRGMPQLTGSASVVVIINDVNEFDPFFRPSTYQALIPANTSFNTDVLRVVAVDIDSGKFGHVRYTIPKSTDNLPFAIDPTTGMIFTSSKVESRKYNFLVVASNEIEDNENVRSDTANVTIIVGDLPNTPMFTEPFYVGHVAEDISNAVITTVKVQGGEYIYSIDSASSEDSSKFSLVNGVLRNTETLDREEKETFILSITAADPNNLSIVASTSVYVIVDDINDNPPNFPRLYSASIREDAMPGDFVILVSSSDPDSTLNSQNRYFLSNNINDTFAIDELTGVVTVNRKLDRETTEIYQLIVNAGDQDWEVHTSLTITVTDSNDNPPRFEQNNYSYRVSNLNSGDLVFSVSANDIDTGINQEVFYSLTTDVNYLWIDHITGKVYTNIKLECTKVKGSLNECPFSIMATVCATDGGLPLPLTSTTKVEVTVEPLNINTPVFEPVLFPVAVLQSSSINTNVATITAIDTDKNSKITFSILESISSDYFKINNTTGVISTSQSLVDFEIGSELRFTVQANDNGVPSLSSNLNVILEITGQNLNRPRFDRRTYESNMINEDVAFGTDVFTINANDEDIGVNGMVIYSLSNEDINKPFTIGQTTGIITTTNLLDYEEITSYTLTIVASDRAVLYESTSATLVIPINDINDHLPEFNSSYFVAYVQENVSPQTIVTRLLAKDLDTSDNAVITYNINPHSVMSIRPLTGDIFTGLRTQLDFESKDRYNFTVSASNNMEKYEDNTTLIIRVCGLNEFIPQFGNLLYNVATPVNTPAGEEIIKLEATDNDAGYDGEVIFTFAEWSKNIGFDLDPLTGGILVSENADLQLGDLINLQVYAKNPGEINVNNIVEVDIVVTVVTDECSRLPCRNEATCTDGPETFTCFCAPGYSGEFCEIELNECDPNPCSNSAQCIDLMGSFTCICDLAFTGNLCEIEIDFCEENPCLNGGTCSGLSGGYFCECSFGYTGQNCEIGSMGFESTSYFTLPTLNIVENHISFEFATVFGTSLLFYNHAALNQTDFVALELIQGKLRLSYRYASSSLYQLSVGDDLADGNWHTVDVMISQFTSSLIVSNCIENIDQEIRCSNTQSHSSLSFIAFENKPFYFGGVSSIDVILSHPNQVSAFDYVGCIRSLTVNDELISAPTSPYILESNNVLDRCIRTESSTGACYGQNNQPTCGENSVCVDQWSNAECQCPSDKSGSTCQNNRVGSTFNGDVFLSYSFKPSIIQQAQLDESNALVNLNNKRKRRQTDNNKSSISIRFRTRNQDGVLFFVEGFNNEQAILYGKDSNLYYSYSSTQDIIVMENISDGLWRTVQVELINQDTNIQFRVSVEGSILLDNTVLNGLRSFVDPLEVKTIYIGGGPSSTTFNGCIFSFDLNGEPQPLADDGSSSYLVVSRGGSNTSQNVTLGCKGSDVCASNPCEPPFFCSDIWNAFECIPLGQCEDMPCLNNGTCIPNVNGSYQCQCTSNYQGEDCGIYLPCLSKNCDLVGPNRICIANLSSTDGTSCVCRNGYNLTQGRCELLATAGFPLWIIGVIAGILLLLVIVGVVLIRRWRVTKNRSKTQKPEETVHNGVDCNGNCGNDHNMYEFNTINGSPTSNGLHITNNNAVNDDLISSTLVNTGDISELRSPEKQQHNINGPNPSNLKHKHSFKNNATPPKTLILPSYDVIMQKRNSLQQEELSARGTPPVYEKRPGSITPKIPSNVASSGDNASDITSVSGNNKRGQRSRTRTPVSVDLPITEIIDTDNLTVYQEKQPQYLPNGRASPLKSMTAMSLLRNTHRPNGYSSRPSSYIPPSLSDRSRRISGSAASSSTTSSFEHDHEGSYVSSDKVATIEDMVKHLKGLVGLTSEEIAVLNENSQASCGSTTNGSVISSYPPSVIEPPIRRTPGAENNPYRPSSLPGRRINSVFTGTRSKTPMAIPMNSLYKPSKRSTSTLGYNLPPDLYPSEHLQPPPDTSSDEDDMLFVSRRRKQKKKNRISVCEDISETDFKDSSNIEGFNLELLSAYGKNFEQLAGVFLDLACLPAIAGEDQDIGTEVESISPFSYTSHSTRTTSLKSSLASKSPRNRTVSQGSSEQSGKLRMTSHPGRHSAIPALCLSTSPNSLVSSNRSHSSTAKRRSEHYV